MGPVIHFCLCWFVQFIFVAVAQDANVDLESIIIDSADVEDTPLDKRDTKQILVQTNYAYPLYNFIPQVPQVPIAQPQGNPIAATGSCYTNKGDLGKCVAFRQCYPYFKLPDVSNFDTWILSMYDTCSYFTTQGRQMFGVCCSDIPKPIDSSTKPTIEDSDPQEQSNSTSPNKLNEGAKFPGWPPALPTHPPDHTIPPLPTHPPSPGYPGLVDTTTVAFGSPTKPSKKPTKPKPTNNPTTTTQTYDLGTASCGAKNGFQDQGKIVGGHDADLSEWPWIAALFNGGRQFCGGSLIDKIHILTAAHCVAHMTSWDVARLTVRLGDYNIHTDSEVRHIEKTVKRIVRHRGFNSRTLYNDIALLTLNSPVEFTPAIRAVCLPSSSIARDWAGSVGTVIGWGSLRESGKQPSVLQEVDIPIWSNQNCRLKYGPAAPGGIVDHMVCAGEANKDSCSGDSGGPLMVNHGKWTQVGIVSWGIGCGKGQYPGVYTRVESFLPWIRKNLAK